MTKKKYNDRAIPILFSCWFKSHDNEIFQTIFDYTYTHSQNTHTHTQTYISNLIHIH